MATVVLSATLTEYAKHKSKIQISGSTLFALLINLIQTFPQLRTQLFDIQGELTKKMNFYLNNETVTAKYWQNIPINKRDVVSILLASRTEKISLSHQEKEIPRPPRNDRRDRLKLVYSVKVEKTS